MKPDIDIQGHRGCRGLMPENTIPAMIKAIDLGVQTLEMDCVISRDKKVVVSHDNFMSHEFVLQPNGESIEETEERKFNLYQLDYEAIRMFDVGSKVHPRFPDQKKFSVEKPLLSSLIDSVENYVNAKGLKPLYYNIETKLTPAGDVVFHPNPNEFVNLLMSVVLEKKIEDRVIVQSFDVRTLQVIHQLYPKIKTALLVENELGLEANLAVLGFVPAIYSPDFELLNEELVNSVHEKNMSLIPWTINKNADMERIAKMGVDGIITDYPDKAIKLFGNYQK
ncbi:glycerophosphodiester phosphodiesterase family protein [Solitalea lacus]|uniref:glycerophosphodiester phosphodiesterase family protein n=1 Tax=Solitalea lacus TaxID=2911172 RepID=UPI001EDA5922|nr:glycerophosphodiester phosphodiesterase family protein [Solitalea lacus]UKJ08464.1 glycerophosphodiester phosphodiesterase [Solitalea lacus]